VVSISNNPSKATVTLNVGNASSPSRALHIHIKSGRWRPQCYVSYCYSYERKDFLIGREDAALVVSRAWFGSRADIEQGMRLYCVDAQPTSNYPRLMRAEGASPATCNDS
jgi:hypothetical protein